MPAPIYGRMFAPRNGERLDGGSCHSSPVPKIYFDERIAERYDAFSADMFEPAVVEPAVNFLADLAGEGGALELGIGTGRIALPLSKRGVRVHGIDVSPAMVARLRAKPGADDVGVTIGDFAATKVGSTFRLAYLVFNTIMNLTTQDEQVECFRNVAAHLEPGGRFVIEVGVPGLQRLPPGETFRAFTVSPTRLGFDEYDIAAQILSSHHYWVVDGQLEVFSAPYRYVWPSELDLMARLAGMTLRERWSGWARRALHERKHHARFGVGEDRVAGRLGLSTAHVSAESAKQGGPAQLGLEELDKVLPRFCGVGGVGVRIAEQVDVAGNLEQVVPESVEVELRFDECDTGHLGVRGEHRSVSGVEHPQVALRRRDERRLPVHQSGSGFVDHDVRGMRFAMSDHHPPTVGADVQNEPVEVDEKRSDAVRVLSEQTSRRFSVRAGRPGFAHRVERQGELATTREEARFDTGIWLRHLSGRVELHDPLQHGGSVVSGPKLAVLARRCSRQIGVHHHRVPLVEAPQHNPIHADEWRDHEVETGLLTEGTRRAERALEADERGVRRANGR